MLVFRMQERQVKEQQIEHAKKILKIQEQLKTNLSQVAYYVLCQDLNIISNWNSFSSLFWQS